MVEKLERMRSLTGEGSVSGRRGSSRKIERYKDRACAACGDMFELIGSDAGGGSEQTWARRTFSRAAGFTLTQPHRRNAGSEN